LLLFTASNSEEQRLLSLLFRRHHLQKARNSADRHQRAFGVGVALLVWQQIEAEETG